MNSIIKFFINNRLFGDIVSIFIILVGIVSALMIRREVFPNVSFDIIIIQTIYPGASPDEVEKLITNPLEQDLQEVDGIKKMQSVSIEGQSRVILFLDPDQTTEAEAKADVQDIVDLFQPPADAEDPLVIALESKQQPIVEVSISADVSDIELRTMAKEFEKKIESVRGVAKVVHSGLRDLEVRVEADPQLLNQKSISLDALALALKLQNLSIPAGTIESEANGIEDQELIVRTIGDFNDLDEIRNTVIRANEFGKPVLVQDVAKVFYDLKKATRLNRTNGKPSLSLTVLKKEKADAIQLVDQTRTMIEENALKYKDKGFNFSFINDFSIFIRRRLSILTTNLLVGLVFVAIVLAFFLPFRVAIFSVVGILISFLGTMYVFNINDFSINLISLLGLIIVSGMLVDDAIVVSDNIVRKMEEGENPTDASISGATEIWPAVAASVMTTIVAFLPMMFMSGIFGKFVKQIPLGVIIALLFSLFEAIWILPQHIANYVTLASIQQSTNPKNLKRRFQIFWDQVVVIKYVKIVKVLLRRRYLAMASIGLFFVFSIVIAKVGLKFVLFPPEGIETFFVRIKAPTGFSLDNTLRLVKPIEDKILELPKEEILDFVTTIGIIQQDANDPNTKRGSEYAQIAVYMTPETDRDREAPEIITALKNSIVKSSELEKLTFERINPGPPVGKPISVAIHGENYDDIMKAVADLKPRLAKIPGVLELDDSYVPGKEEVQLIVNRSEAAAAGLSVSQIGATVRGVFDGIIATSIQELEDEVDIRVSFSKADRSRLTTLNEIKIPNAQGQLIPLFRVTNSIRKRGVAVYQHEANRREVKVTGEVNTDIISATQVAEMVDLSIGPEIEKLHPKVKITQGGEDEDTKESLQSLGRAFLLAFMGIFLILILTFKNLLQPFLVVLTIPLGIMSVIWTLFIARMPLSFMAMLGVVALAGVIVNNSIILIDFVNQARLEGLDRWESIERAVKNRIRPIFLTSTTTVAGLLPTAHGIGGLDKFVVPIAMSLGYGILFGSILTAFFFPCAIAVVDDIQEFFFRRSQKSKNV